jgi:uncharacterized tellurite resistance protein B-like protein
MQMTLTGALTRPLGRPKPALAAKAASLTQPSAAALRHHRGMLKSMKDLLARLVPPPPDAEPRAAEHTLQLATAVLLVEVMRADVEIGDAERRAVLDALRDKFALDDTEGRALTELAEQTARNATDLFEFTSHVNAHFEMPAKLRMIEHMWRVAYADGHLSAHERHVLWRVADLLHVPQGAYINAKMRARDAAGAQD